MTPLETFLAYAADFERSFVDDDWTRCEKYFAEDGVYEVTGLSAFACRLQGPKPILEGMKKSVDTLDRKLDSRKIDVLGEVAENGNAVDVDWKVTYTLGEAPPFELVGHSHGEVVDGKIVRLVDSYTDEMDEAAVSWIQEHASGLGISGSYT